MDRIQKIAFRPFPGLSSPHAQTILGSFSRKGSSPPSLPKLIPLQDGDVLSCEISQPLLWKIHHQTIFMIHGLGGSHASHYMVRIGKKLFDRGYRVVRINLRGCGSGKGLAVKPYHGGNSDDILAVLQKLKEETPDSAFTLIGFSLGGNISLKLLGELGNEQEHLLAKTIAVCPPIDLAQTVDLLELPSNRLYHRYYQKKMKQDLQRWIKHQVPDSIREFDETITAPQWGYQNADDYYRQCSSKQFLPFIKHPCHLLFAKDDPFINYLPLLNMSIPPSVRIGLSSHGGHMGFLGWNGSSHPIFALDYLIQGLITL